MSEANQDPVLMQVKDGVAAITLNRPNAMNTMNIELLDALLSSLEIATSDPHCRVIVLTGAGNVFCAGGDLVLGLETINGPGPLAAQTGRLRRFMRVSQLLHECDAITVAAVNGACAGGGLSIACACDLRVASSNAKFNAGFQSVGVSGDFGITWLLPRLVGQARARRMLFTPSNSPPKMHFQLGSSTRWFRRANH
jgi:2-(1,2-epoxy-1,2-dihydrophenyl)acetyl-CoA isomerase